MAFGDFLVVATGLLVKPRLDIIFKFKIISDVVVTFALFGCLVLNHCFSCFYFLNAWPLIKFFHCQSIRILRILGFNFFKSLRPFIMPILHKPYLGLILFFRFFLLLVKLFFLFLPFFIYISLPLYNKCFRWHLERNDGEPEDYSEPVDVSFLPHTRWSVIN